MERLWTPWRRAFIEGASAAGTTPTCFLCDAPAAGDDRAKLIVLRGEHAYVLLNLYPYNSGHLLVAPYLHTGDLARLDSAIAQQLMLLTQRCVRVLEQAYRPHAFNTGMNLGQAAGAGVPDHLHIHIVPRWNGDTSFMPIVAETKTLPETIDETYTRLEPLFRA